ncbi:MAG: class A beta-lactamase-related serine hydrolase [Betaproteobacteria bacterium]|nr:class A beta-lactamase-related serine hydrolase [Betaproteobacteria bacterium]
MLKIINIRFIEFCVATFATCLTLNGFAASQSTEVLQMRADGPDADRMGYKDGYPSCIEALTKTSCRVGTWSSNHRVQRSVKVHPATIASAFARHPSPPPVSWRWGLFAQSIDDFMDKTKTTGLMILKDGQVVAERYQYDRKPGMPMRSFSMAKTVTALLIGMAQARGHIASLDDQAAAYWPEIAESAYGQTSLRDLLRMSSGVLFRELYTWTPDDDIWVWGRLLYAPENRNQPQRIEAFLRSKTSRDAQPGTRFHYATIETEILGRVLRKATGKSIAELTEDWLWKPMGAEHEAYWLVSTTDGAEGVGGSFNASLRDYARLGLLMAQDGRMGDKQIVPREFLLDATEVQRQPAAFHPRRATPYLGYGYQVWLLPMKTRTFVLQGIHGQAIFVQPSSRIVFVQTSANDWPSGRQDIVPYQLRDAFWRGVLTSLGGSVE